MVNKLVIPLIFIFSFWQADAQNQNDSLTLSLKMEWKENPLILHKTYISENKDTLQLHQLKFYLCNIQIEFEDKTNFKQEECHLIDIEDLSTMWIPICKNQKKIFQKSVFPLGLIV